MEKLLTLGKTTAEILNSNIKRLTTKRDPKKKCKRRRRQKNE
jgi:hypothetical protein